MTIRTYILLAYLLIAGGGFYYLLQRNLAELAPRYLESMEESQVDNVNILASIIESETRGAAGGEGGALDSGRLHALFDGAFRRRFNAAIYSLSKTQVNVRVYATDARGIVIYDSREKDSAEGQDYSQKHDVHMTLQGNYGARSSREDPGNPLSLMLYVSAPIRATSTADSPASAPANTASPANPANSANTASAANPANSAPPANAAAAPPLGVVAIGKPAESINQLVDAARRRTIIAGLAGGGMILLLGIAFSMWVTAPITRLTAYARATRDGRTANIPRLAKFEGREVRELREAFEEMRAALEGKAYVERYVQTLTHEIKSPLSAIRGAAEILRENPPPPGEVRARFLGNITAETARIQRIVDQLLQLAALEARKARANLAALDLAAVAREACDAAQPAAQASGVALILDAPAPAPARGDRALLAQALGNLLQNAIEFTPAGGRVVLGVRAAPAATTAPAAPAARELIVSVEDNGAGIPDFAAGRLFEKFYSLARPRSGVKSTGLGLSLVREIAHLHSGEVTVVNRPAGEQGVRAEMRFPSAP